MIAFTTVGRIALILQWEGQSYAKAIGSPVNNRNPVCPHRSPLGGWQRLRDSDGGKIDWGSSMGERTTFVRGGLLHKRNIKGSFQLIPFLLENI